ncbi:MAG: lysylphosphatidylglycerol synthase transmembrane domain-containing protein, partial [Bacteroidota bacterium]
PNENQFDAFAPASVGGSAVALFVLAQEKLSTARVATIVVYSAVLDTLFFVGTLPILLLLFGPTIIRPQLTSFSNLDGWGYTFLFAYIFMACYGTLFFYGLFINPRQIKRLLVAVTKIRFLKRYEARARQLGDDIIIASGEIWRKRWTFHVSAFLSTATAWSCRFLLVNCLIIGIVSNVPLDLMSQGALYARLQTMFVIMAFSPTPGGVGFAEVVFGGFLSDYVPSGIAPIIAFIWRFLTYYLYLIAGAIIIPNWIRTIINRRQKAKQERN